MGWVKTTSSIRGWGDLKSTHLFRRFQNWVGQNHPIYSGILKEQDNRFMEWEKYLSVRYTVQQRVKNYYILRIIILFGLMLGATPKRMNQGLGQQRIQKNKKKLVVPGI
ncbi:MAG: hypothetical protein EZS28_031269 [Streblomastix strix]|uniref:Uncharacterized protein n=1 Tax=Streblomastix strix TaxID=222440 RepID=A0A5J4USK6_9EUKA|nr:MAG: hypothetical protein EZS28_031269 [Streblomastix strix]